MISGTEKSKQAVIDAKLELLLNGVDCDFGKISENFPNMMED
jgi:hypothetical protein